MKVTITDNLKPQLNLDESEQQLGFRYLQNLRATISGENNTLDLEPRNQASPVMAVADPFPSVKAGSVPVTDSFHLLYAGNIASGTGYCLYFDRISTTLVNLSIVLYDTSNSSVSGTQVLATFTMSTGTLRSNYDTCIGLNENEQLFFIVQGIVDAGRKRTFVVNVRKSLATIITSGSTSTYEATDGLVGLSSDSVRAFLLKNARLLTNSLTFASRVNSLTEVSTNNYSTYRFTTGIDPSPGFTNRYEIVVARAGEIASAVYYPMDYWVTDIPRTQNTSESRITGNLSRRFFFDEPDARPFSVIVSEPASFSQAFDGRVGSLVVSLGLPADRTFAVTEGGTVPEAPVTATNNRFVPGSNFMSFAANWTPATILMRGVTRPRYFFTISNASSNLVVTQNNTPHFMYSTGVTGTDVFAFGSISSNMVGGYLFNGTFNLKGNVVSYIRVNQQLTNPLNTRSPIQRSTYLVCPYSPGFRINDVDTLNGSDSAYFPIFGIDTNRIKSFYKLSNRLAVILDDGTMYLSTIGVTHPNYPSLFDFQVKLDGSEDNAVKVKLNTPITGVTELPGGYLITTDNGLYQYDLQTSVVTLIAPGKYNGVINNGGYLYVLTGTNKITAYIYSDESKQVVAVNAGNFIPGNSYFNASDIYKFQDYPINDNARITGMGNNWIAFLNETQIFNKHIYEVAYAQPILDLIASVANPQNNFITLPLRLTRAVPVGTDTVDWFSDSRFPTWDSTSIATTVPRVLKESNRNAVSSFAAGSNEIAAYQTISSTVSGSIVFTCIAQSTRQTYSSMFGGATRFKQSEVSVSTKWVNPGNPPVFAYFPVYERNSSFLASTNSNNFYSLIPTAFNSEFRAKVRVPFSYTSHFIQWTNASISNVSIDVQAI